MKKKRPEQPASPSSGGAVHWSTPAGRVRWLLENRFQGNRSAFAEAIGLSHTIISKVVGGQAPGRKLLAAIAEELRVSSAWLLTGAGQPYQEVPDLGGRPGLPVTQVLLPGPPLEHQDLLTGGWIDVSGQLFALSQYWLLLTSSQPVVRDPAQGFRVGDQLLMETDRTKFPRQSKLSHRLCIVRLQGDNQSLKLGAVTHYEADPDSGPERLEVNTFDLEPDPSTRVQKVVYLHFPGGEIQRHEETLKLSTAGGTKGVRPLTMYEVEPALPTIRYSDIVAVWLQILRRPDYVPG